MKSECLVNREGEHCPFPPVNGGRCEYHQVPQAAKRHQQGKMKSARKNSHRKEIMSWSKK